MKEGWEYKKLGDVCEILDSRRKPITKNKRESGTIPYYGATGILDYVKDYIFDEKLVLLGEDGAKWGAGENSAYIIEGKSWVNNHAHILKIDDSFMDIFVMYYLNHKDLSEYITGAVVPKLTQAAMLKIPVPNISIADQQRSVAELDCLNEMIALKQEQLKEFDKLAQSIFYDMFGDPVSNEKGWQIKKIGDVASFYNGKAHENDIDENGEFVLINAKFIASDGMILKRTNKQLFPLFENDIVMVMSDVPNGKALARCFLIKHNNIYSLNQRICAFRDYSLNSIFLLFLLNRNKYYLRFDDGNGQTNLRKNDVLGCPVILPPLALQQQFAEKIQAIEVQKELVRKSIAETQHLLDSRMDYYFD